MYCINVCVYPVAYMCFHPVPTGLDLFSLIQADTQVRVKTFYHNRTVQGRTLILLRVDAGVLNVAPCDTTVNHFMFMSLAPALQAWLQGF